MNLILKIITIILLLFPVSSFSQTNEWVNFTCGLDILALEEEGDYLWIGTLGGGLIKMNKITGEIIHFDKANSGLPDNNVSTITIDAEGNKWIGTHYGGIAKFDGINWITYNTINSQLPVDYINDITIDILGNKWISTSAGGLVAFNGINWVIYNKSNFSLPEDYVNAVVIDDQNNK